MLRRNRLAFAKIAILSAVATCCALPAIHASADTTATWNGTTGNWSDFARWSTNPFFPSNNFPAGSLYDVTISSGSISLDVSPIIQQLTINGGTLAGTGDLTVLGLMSWSGGATLQGSGTITTTDLSISLFGSSVTMADTRALVSTGNATWTSNAGFAVSMGAGNSYTNAGTFTINTTGGPTFSGGTFINAGSLIKSSSDTNTINSVFSNSGTVTVASGILNLAGGGTYSAGLFTSTGAGLVAFGGTQIFNAGSSVSGANFNFTSGTDAFNAGAIYNGTGITTISGAAVSFNAGAVLTSLGSTLTLSAGALTLNSAPSFSVPAFNATGGTLLGSANFSTAVLNWSGGSVLGGSGTLTATDLNISLFGNSVSLADSRAVVVTGNTLWTSNAGFTVNLGTGNSFTNAGTFTINTTGGPAFSGGMFINTGAIIKNSADGGGFNSPFQNSGTVTVNAGVLNLAGGGAHTGKFFTTGSGAISFGGVHDFNAGASVTSEAINFATGTDNFNAGSSLTVAGTVTLGGAILNLNTGNPLSTTVLNASAGTLQGSDNVTVTSSMSWSGGAILGGSGTITTKDLDLSLFGNSVTMADSRALVSTGNATWTSNAGFSVNLGTGNTYTNAGTFTIATTSNPNFNGGAFVNAGSLIKNSSDTNTISSTFSNSGSVTVTAGVLNLTGGGIQNAGLFSSTGAGVLAFGGAYTFNAGSSVTGTNFNFATGTDTFNSGAIYNASASTTVSGAAVSFNAGSVLTSLGNTLTLSAGSLALNSAPSFSLPTFNANGGTLLGSANITAATLNWSGGAVLGGSGTVTATDLNISLFSNNVTLADTRLLVVTGSTNWTSNAGFTVNLGTSNSFTNLGTFTINTTGGPSFSGGIFLNAGSIVKNSDDSAAINSTFNNSGTVTVNAGVLTFAGGGTQTGKFSTTGTGAISFGGVHDFNAGASVTSGAINFASGTDNFNAGSSLNVAGTVTLSGALLNLNTGNPFSTTVLNTTGGTLQGSDNVTVTSTMSWAGGTILGGSGTITTADLDIALIGNNVTMADSRALVSTGNATWTSNAGFSVNLGTGNTYTNAGTFTINTTANPTFNGGAFVNAGSLIKNSSDTNTISSTFSNSGSVTVNAGVLNLTGGGTHSAGLFASTGTGTLAFGGTHTFNAGSSVTGSNFNFAAGADTFNTAAAYNASDTTTVSGAAVSFNAGAVLASLGSTVTLSAGALTLNSAPSFSVPTFNATGGTLLGSASVISTTLNWSAGSAIGGTGTFTTTDLNLTLIGSGVSMLGSRALVVNGSTNWTSSAGFSVSMSATNTFTNAGIFTIDTTGDAAFSGGTFFNTGSIIKNSSDGAGINSAFFNSGTVTVNAGVLNLAGGGGHSGKFFTTGTGAISFGSIHDFNAGASVTSGAINFASGTDNFNAGSSLNVAGTVTVSGAVLNLNSGSPFSASVFNAIGGSLLGSDNVSVTSTMAWSGGATLRGSGTITTKDLNISLIGNAVTMAESRNLLSTGNATWTSNAGFSVNLGTGNTYTNAGTFTINTTGNATFSGGTFINSGLLVKSSTDTNVLSSLFTNSGTLTVNAGSLNIPGTTTNVSNIAGVTTLSGGTWNIVTTLAIASPPNITANNASVFFFGPASTFSAFTDALDTNNGDLHFLNRRTFAAAGAFTNNGTLELGGGFLFASSLTNNASGTVTGFGTVSPRILNHGTIITRGGGLTFSNGINGGSGTVQVNSDGSLDVTGGAVDSNGDVLTLQSGGLLFLSSNNFLVKVNYANAAFGTGNTFNKHAGVFATTGKLLADGPNTQVLTGNVSGGDQAAAVINFGSIHVGDTKNFFYQINNVAGGAGSGPSVLYAVQTAAHGASITDARLSGSGITAQNIGPVSLGGSSAQLPITFRGLTSGSLTLQSIHIANNFDGNTAASTGSASLFEQTAAITGAAWNLAAGQATPIPLNLLNHHVGDVVTAQHFSISNVAPTDNFSEKLDAATSNNTGNVTIAGAVSLLAAGASDNTSISVTYSTANAGSLAGSATLSFISNGQSPGTSGNSGLGTTALGSVTLSATGGVYRLAAPQLTNNPVLFGNHHLNEVVSQNISVTNNVTDDAFSEKLNGSLSSPTGANLFTGGFSLLAPQGSSNINATLDTSSVGNKSGSVSLTLTSDGSGTSGLGLTPLSTLTLTSSGTVYRLASAQVAGSPVAFGNHHLGDAITASVSITNTAAADGFSETLDGATSGQTGPNLFSGAFSLLAAQGTATVSAALDTSSVGNKAGSTSLILTSDGTGTSGLGNTAVSTVTLTSSGTVYRLAAGQVAGSPVVFGNHHVGDVVTAGVSVTNTAAVDGFSEKLDATLSGPTGTNTFAGGLSLLAPQGSGTITATLDTSGAGAKAGAAALTLVSDGTGTSGLGNTALSTITLTSSGTVYRLASAQVVGTPVDFSNHHLGDLITQNITITNTAANDGFSESLDGTLTNPSGANNFITSFSLLAAQSSKTITATLDTSVAGSRSGSTILTLVSDGTGTSGLGNTAISTVTLTSAGTVYRFAAPQITGSPVAFSNHHVGDVVTASVAITNNVANDGFSESLDATLSNPTGTNGFSGNFTQLAPQSSQNITATLDTSSAGAKSGSSALTFASNGAGSSGLGTTPLSTVTLTSSGSVYRLAQAPALPTTINLGVLHVNSPGSSSLSVSNLAANDGFSEKLNASFTGSTGHATTSGGPISVNSGATISTMAITLDTASAGIGRSGTASVHFDSDGTSSSGLGITSLLSDQTVTIKADVYNFAAAALQKNSGDGTFILASATAANLNFGTISPDSFVSASLAALNTAAGPADTLSGTWTINAAEFGAGSFVSFSDIAAGSSLGDLNVTFSSDVVGLHTGTITLHPVSVDVNLASATLPDFVLNISANVTVADVPEPASAALLFAATPLLLRRRRRR